MWENDLRIISRENTGIEIWSLQNFSPDFAAASKEGLFDDEKSQGMVNHVVCEHFLRKGYLDIAEELMSEANMQIPENYKEPFSGKTWTIDRRILKEACKLWASRVPELNLEAGFKR